MPAQTPSLLTTLLPSLSAVAAMPGSRATWLTAPSNVETRCSSSALLFPRVQPGAGSLPARNAPSVIPTNLDRDPSGEVSCPRLNFWKQPILKIAVHPVELDISMARRSLAPWLPTRPWYESGRQGCAELGLSS